MSRPPTSSQPRSPAASAVCPRVDVAIVSHNTAGYLLALLRSIEGVLPLDRLGTVHVWDNASSDASEQMLARFSSRAPWLRVHLSKTNVHHGPALDALLRTHCLAPWVLVLDSDTRILRDFLPELDLGAPEPPAFVGQIHPLMHHLYAYLAHLLVQRDWYLELPGFCRDGAPGRAYFEAIESRRIPYQRFRWSDWIEHAGQASLRALVERVDTANELYSFAREQVDENAGTATRRRYEAELGEQVAALVTSSAASDEATRVEAVSWSSATAPDQERQQRRPQWRRRWVGSIRSPRVAWWVRRARRIGLVQKHQEAMEIARFVRRQRPRRVLEIGTARGGSLYLWTRCAAADATLVSVDLPPWELDDPWEPQVVERFQRWARREQRIHLLREDSHSLATRRRVESLLGDGVDFLFIDGDHTYEGVARDYEWYAPLVRPGGWIAFHDIHPHSHGWGGEVPRLWAELSPGACCREILADGDQDGFGVGLLKVASR